MLFNGRGGEFPGIIESIEKKQTRVRTFEWQMGCAESPLQITLAPSISSREKMDLIVQKAVELGVFSLQPVITERSVARFKGERSEERVQHWQKVAIAACEQCGRNTIPEIRPLMPLDAALLSVSELDARFFLHPSASVALRDTPRPASALSLLVGPEGGYANNEVDLIVKQGFTPISLGPRVLRMETAALAQMGLAGRMYWLNAVSNLLDIFSQSASAGIRSPKDTGVIVFQDSLVSVSASAGVPTLKKQASTVRRDLETVFVPRLQRVLSAIYRAVVEEVRSSSVGQALATSVLEPK